MFYDRGIIFPVNINFDNIKAQFCRLLNTQILNQYLEDFD